MPTLPPSRTWGRSFQRYFPASALAADAKSKRRRQSKNGKSSGDGATPLLDQPEAAFSDEPQQSLWRRVWGSSPVLYAKLPLGSLVIAFVMLAWPVGVGASNNEQVTKLSFAVFQLLYTVISFPVLLMQGEVPLGNLSWKHRIGLLVGGQVVVQGLIAAFALTSDLQSLGLVRTLGEFSYGAFIFTYFVVKGFRYTDSFAEAIANDTAALQSGPVSLRTAPGTSQAEHTDPAPPVSADTTMITYPPRPPRPPAPPTPPSHTESEAIAYAGELQRIFDELEAVAEQDQRERGADEDCVQRYNAVLKRTLTTLHQFHVELRKDWISELESHRREYEGYIDWFRQVRAFHQYLRNGGAPQTWTWKKDTVTRQQERAIMAVHSPQAQPGDDLPSDAAAGNTEERGMISDKDETFEGERVDADHVTGPERERTDTVCSALALPSDGDADGVGAAQRPRAMTKDFVGADESESVNRMLLGATSEPRITDSATGSFNSAGTLQVPGGSPQNMSPRTSDSSWVGRVSAASLAFEADVRGTGFAVAASHRQVLWDPDLENLSDMSETDLVDMERRFVASQLRCPISSWFLSPRLRHPASRYPFYLVFNLLGWANYFFVQWCAQVLFAADDSHGTERRSLLSTLGRYLLFSSVVFVVGFIAMRWGRACDTLKTAALARRRFPRAVRSLCLSRPDLYPMSILDRAQHGNLGDDDDDDDPPCEGEGNDGLNDVGCVSTEMVAQILVCYFYAFFFRALFQQLETWPEFAVVSLGHVAVIGGAYPLRMTRVYFLVSDKVQLLLRDVPVLSLVYDPSNGAQWNTRIALDYMVHLMTAVTATLAFLVATAFLRFGYNSGRYKYFGAGLSDHEFGMGMAFVAAGAGVELVVAFAMVLSTRGLVRGGVTAPLTHLLRSHIAYPVFLMCCGAHVCTDVFLAHVKLGPAKPVTTSTVAPTDKPSLHVW